MVIRILDLFRNSIWSLKSPFLASFLQNLSTMCSHMLSKFCRKPGQKWQIFAAKASFERSLFLLILSLSATLSALDPSLSVSIDEEHSYAHFPLQGWVMITHSNDEPVDEEHFSLEGKKLEVSLVKETKLSAGGGAILSIYAFQIPAKEAGLYKLSPVSIKVGDKILHSIATSYTVREESSDMHRRSPLTFRLEASIDGPQTLFIGERTKLVYRIYYNNNIDLSASQLPMIHPAHFQKIGDVLISEDQEGDTTVQTLSQEIEAIEEGSFVLGPSSIEGYSYQLEGTRKIYQPPLLKATANPITLTVLSPLKKTKPSSFTGAIGNITANSSLSTNEPIQLGETIHLLISVGGIENLEGFSLPPLICQPGFKGFFELSTLPPLAEVRGEIKIFDISLRPINAYAREIPSTQLSSFDPQTHSYIIVETKSQPITLIPSNKVLEWPSLAPLIITFPSGHL